MTRSTRLLVRALLRRAHIWQPPELAARWLSAWQESAVDFAELQIPLRLMAVAVEFMRTGDRNALLELSVEQRTLLDPEIEYYLRSTGQLTDDTDRAIAATVDQIRRKSAAQRGSRSGPSVATVRPLNAAILEQLLAAYDEHQLPFQPLNRLLGGEWFAMSSKQALPLIMTAAADDEGLARALARPGLEVRRIDCRRLGFSARTV